MATRAPKAKSAQGSSKKAPAKQQNTRQQNIKAEVNTGLPKEVLVIIGLIVAVLLELSNFNVFGTVGGWVKYVQFGLFGIMAYLFPVFLLILFIFHAFAGQKRVSQTVFGIIFFICLCAFSHLLAYDLWPEGVFASFTLGAEGHLGGGILGGLSAEGLHAAVGSAGSYIILIILMLLSLFMVFRKTVMEWISGTQNRKTESKERYSKSSSHQTLQRQTAVEPASSSKNRKVSMQRRNSRGEKIEEKTYESEEGTIIKIVSSNPNKKRTKRAQVTRTRKAAPVRDGSVRPTRTQNKSRGISDRTQIVEKNAGGDEVHEITNHPKQSVDIKITEAAAQAVPERPQTSVITVTDVITAPSAVQEPPVQESNESQMPARQPEPVEPAQTTEPAPTTVVKHRQIKPSEPSEKKERSSLSGKTFSTGEPVRTFKPVTTYGKTPVFRLPSMDLLARSRSQASDGGDMHAMAEKLENVMANFGVNVKVINTQVGPSVTRFELQPELGTRVNKITSLADDLKLNLAVPDIRIEAPIPGRAAVGIEIPNKTRQTVTMRELLEAPALINHPSKIAFAAGKDISGNVIVADIATMPHLLVAGTTGSGKSTFLNTMIMCILYRARPDEVGFIIIDPKRIEFGVYAGIPHLMKNVVTDPAQAVSTLRWAVAEMTERYQRMQYSGVKDFKSYNEKFERGEISEDEPNPRKMHQIVIVIDELADLMMVAAKEAESLICRLAQLARAAGIHLVIATQRPSVDVVTGLIKANIPARVALLVASGVDSRTIIDMVGAEKLLGHGDMLFYPTGYVKPVRAQGAYVSEKEIHDTVQYLIQSAQGQQFFAEESEKMGQYQSGEVKDAGIPGENSDSGESGGSKYDDLLREAGLACIEMGKASSSMLQRRFSIGFNRAARIIDQLYEIGAIGPQNGAKPREILVDSMTFEEKYQSLE